MSQNQNPETEISPTEASERVIELAKKIESWRVAHAISKEKMPERFKDHIRSYRGIERAVKGELGEMNLEAHLSQFESIWALINSPAPKPKQKSWDDTSLALQLRNAFVRTMTKTGPNRVILLIAPTGRGKTGALQALQQIYKAPRVILCEASKVWKDKPLALLGHIWECLGKTDELGHGPKALQRVVASLKENRICIAIDESHYLGPEQLNTLTTLVNLTPGEFILAGQPTLWSRLERDKGAFLETRQLTGNRLSRRIKSGSLSDSDAGDVKLMVERRLPWLNGQSKQAVTMLLKQAPQHGNLAFVRNVIERTEEAADEGATLDWQAFTDAVNAEVSER
jgi:type II secretory pathway predicted ATPase ExeA